MRSYDLNSDSVFSLIIALEGDEGERVKWLANLRKWVAYRTRQMKILELAEKWWTERGRQMKIYLHFHEWDASHENRLRDWVYYQMEYCSGLSWDEKTQKVKVYENRRPLLKEESIQELLDFINAELNNEQN